LDDSFSSRMTELRKGLGQSQKEAAAGLGISQALLSHYEKGIRECGLAFVVKASEYYGVTCDYLLGRSASRHGLKESSGDLPDDNTLTAMTLVRAFTAVRDNLHGHSPKYGDIFDRFFAMNLYRILLVGVKSGEIPYSWIGENTPFENEVYWEALAGLSALILNAETLTGAAEATKPPLCVKTLVREVERFFCEQLADSLPILEHYIRG